MDEDRTSSVDIVRAGYDALGKGDIEAVLAQWHFGDTGPASNFLALDMSQRIVMDVYMLLGRLEILPVLVTLHLAFEASTVRRASSSR